MKHFKDVSVGEEFKFLPGHSVLITPTNGMGEVFVKTRAYDLNNSKYNCEARNSGAEFRLFRAIDKDPIELHDPGLIIE